MQCSLHEKDIYYSPNVSTIYKLPLLLEQQGIGERVTEKFALLNSNGERFVQWNKLVNKLESATDAVKIAVVGKYATSKDAYMSVFEALTHAGVYNNVRVNSELIDATDVENNKVKLADFNGFVIPGGFGGRAVEGKIKTIQFARENKKPLLGICYGFQLTVVEICRNLLGWSDANTTEINENTTHPVIDLLPEQKNISEKGATMRLGVKKTLIKKGTLAHEVYKSDSIYKRFRHRWEMNPNYVSEVQDAGIVFSGTDETGKINKVLEVKNHPFLFGMQFHPEFDSRLERAEESFAKLVGVSKKC